MVYMMYPPAGSFILRTPCGVFTNKNTAPKRGVVSATYPNDTSAARCIGRRQRNGIYIYDKRQYQ